MNTERSFPSQAILWICNTFLYIKWIGSLWQELPLVSGTGTAKVTAHVPNCWEKLFPGSTFSHPEWHEAPRWEEPCDRERLPPCHLPRDTVPPCHLPRDRWAAGDQENLVELGLGMESKAADLLIFQADLPIAKPSKQETHSWGLTQHSKVKERFPLNSTATGLQPQHLHIAKTIYYFPPMVLIKILSHWSSVSSCNKEVKFILQSHFKTTDNQIYIVRHITMYV